MIIEKSFEVFKSLVVKNETRDRIFQARIRNSWLDKIINFLFIDDIIEISVESIEKNRLFIVFIEEKESMSISYNIEFIKRTQDGYIEIKNNHPSTAIYFSRINSKIKNRIIENWDKTKP